MTLISCVAFAFGLFMAWTTWGEIKYRADPLSFGPWGHYFLTICMGVGSVATMATAIRVLFF
jgi:hypothetical protein